MYLYSTYLPYKNEEKTHKKENTYIMKIQGEGKIKVKPDIAVISLGIVTENKEIEKSQKENDLITNKVIKALKELGVDKEDIETTAYYINKTYDYVDGKQEFRGYEVRHYLQITIRDIKKVGKAYNVAVENGANLANDIIFNVSNAEMYYLQALNLAIQNAKQKAKSMAKTLGIILNKIPIKIIEESHGYGKEEKYKTSTLSLEDSINTPIQPKDVEIIARITTVFEYR